MVISNGGTVVDSLGRIGFNNSSSNDSVLVTGSNAIWSNSTSLYVGYSGSGNSMVISNGGTVVSPDGKIGLNKPSLNNSVLVTGSNSLWSNRTLLVGANGGGILTVANGGKVTASTSINIAQGSIKGTLNIGSLGGNDTAGTISTPNIYLSGGGATINFNQSNTTTFDTIINYTGTVQQLGSGTTILTGSNSYDGSTFISRGTLLANNTAGSAVGTSSVLVTNVGTLGGNGTIGGPLTVASGGTLAPGINGVGSLTLTNGLTLQTGSTTTFLINSTNNFTSINLNGSAVSYGGILTFNLTSYATSAALGDALTLFNYTSGATESGDFTSVNAIGDNFAFTDVSGIWTGTNANGVTYQFTTSTGVLEVTAVPEPSTYALFGLALGVLTLVITCRTSSLSD